jgi:hypothetical protein
MRGLSVSNTLLPIFNQPHASACRPMFGGDPDVTIGLAQ